MKARLLALAFVVLTTGTIAPLAAQEAHEQDQSQASQTPLEMRAAQVVPLINGELGVELNEVFSEEFLAAVPPDQLTEISSQLTSQFGRALSVESITPSAGSQAELEIRMERALAKGLIAINPTNKNRIVGLRFTQFDPIDDSPAKIEADLAALPGRIGAYFGPVSGDSPTIAINQDDQFAIGSAFKLYILSALSRDVIRGDSDWAQIISIGRTSYPSGITQDWPQPTPITLQTLATLMISISDNTATDALAYHLGRRKIDEEFKTSGHSKPELNAPFLSTRAFFHIKASGKEAIERYRTGDTIERALFADEVELWNVTQEELNKAFSDKPVALDIEWFASPLDLVRLLERMPRDDWDVALNIMSVNPSMPENLRKSWKYVGFKGGSEPGVLNMTWLLRDMNDEWHVLTLSWNNPADPLDETQLELIAQRILSLPR